MEKEIKDDWFNEGNGDDLIKRFKLEPSPLIGKVLSEVEEAQAIGMIKTKKQALKIADKIIKINEASFARSLNGREGK